MMSQGDWRVWNAEQQQYKHPKGSTVPKPGGSIPAAVSGSGAANGAGDPGPSNSSDRLIDKSPPGSGSSGSSRGSSSERSAAASRHAVTPTKDVRAKEVVLRPMHHQHHKHAEIRMERAGEKPPQQCSSSSTRLRSKEFIMEQVVIVLSYILLAVTFPLTIWFCFQVVQEYERAVIFRLGRLRSGAARGPGMFFVLPWIDHHNKVDLRTVSFDVAPQEILSKDSVTVSVDAVVYFRVRDPIMATNNVEDFGEATRLLAATTLRNVLGTKNLAEMLSDRENISHVMQGALDEATDNWGVKVERVEMKDVRLPVQMQRSMAAEAEAAREARAKVIAAEGEIKSSRALKEASEVMAESPSALQLRFLQTLSVISAEKNSTIVFPVPIDIISPFIQRANNELIKQEEEQQLRQLAIRAAQAAAAAGTAIKY